MRILTDTPTLSRYFLVELETSKALFFHMQYLNGTNLIQTSVAVVIIIDLLKGKSSLLMTYLELKW